MQVGKPKVPLRMNFDPLSAGAMAQTPQRLLNRSLKASMNKLAFQQMQQQFSLSARQQIAQGGRSALFDDVTRRLGELQSSLDLPSLTRQITQVTGQAGAGDGIRTTISSGSALNLGTGVSGGSGSSAADIDPTKAIDTQPFADAITAGTVRIQLGSDVVDIAIDPSQSLNDTLAKFSTQTGGRVSASFDDVTNRVVFNFNATGTSFDVDQLDGTNFLSAVTNNGDLATNQTLTGGAAITTSTTEKYYNDLQIKVGDQTLAVTGLKVALEKTVTTTGKNGKTTTSTVETTAADRAAELATQINTAISNAGLQTSLQASATADAKLVLTSPASANAADPLDLNIQVTETQKSYTIQEPFYDKKGNLKGYNTVSGTTLALGLDNAATTIQTGISGTIKLDASGTGSSSGGLAGPEATLKDLAGQLGLSPANGQYEVSVNGTRLAFDENQTLNQVIEAINRSGAGVSASYDAAGQRVVLRQNEAGSQDIAVDDISGNLFNQLGLTDGKALVVQGSAETQTATTQTITELSPEGLAALEQLGGRLGELAGLLQAATAKEGGFKDDALLGDLQEAFSALFRPGDGASFQSLADLGFSLENGQVTFEEATLRGLTPERLVEANAFLGTFIGERVAPLLESGDRAIETDEAIAPLDRRLAQQAVAVQAEVSRLQQRQQLLLFQQVSLEKSEESLKRQGDSLKATRDRLQPGQEDEPRRPFAPQEEPSAPKPQPLAPVGLSEPPVAPGLGSFGLSS